MAAILTALVAVFVFVVTQSFLKLVLELIQEQRKLIGEVASALTIYMKSYTLRVESESMGERLFGAKEEEVLEAEKALRELAGRLRASLWSVPFNDKFALLHMVPKLADVAAAANDLDAWYRNLPGTVTEAQVASIKEYQARIAKRLGIAQRLQALSTQ